MNLLIEKKYSGAVQVFKQNIVLLERDQDNAKGEEASLIHSTLDNSIAVLYCNCALAEYGKPNSLALSCLGILSDKYLAPLVARLQGWDFIESVSSLVQWL